jgi:hypothetical protein
VAGQHWSYLSISRGKASRPSTVKVLTFGMASSRDGDAYPTRFRVLIDYALYIVHEQFNVPASEHCKAIHFHFDIK